MTGLGERLARGFRLSMQAPRALLLAVTVIVGQLMAQAIISGGPADAIWVVAALPFFVYMTWRWRVFWQLSLIGLGVGLILWFGRHVPIWVAACEVLALALLLTPAVRAFFADGLPENPLVEPTPSGEPSDWHKGGRRYTRVREHLWDRFAPSVIVSFCVVQEGAARRPNLGFGSVAGFFRREFAVVRLTNEIAVVRIRPPGLISSRLGETILLGRRGEVDARFDGETLTVDGRPYTPLLFHELDARRVAAG